MDYSSKNLFLRVVEVTIGSVLAQLAAQLGDVAGCPVTWVLG